MYKKRWKSLQAWLKYDSVMTHKIWSFDGSILFCRCLHMAASSKKLKPKLCWPQAYTPSHLTSELTSHQSRRFFPKCSIPMPVASDPPGFGSMEETYGWAHAFMRRAAHHFGKDYIKERLDVWDWSLSSAFSGVGCAEQVPVLNSSRFQMCLINSPLYLLCPSATGCPGLAVCCLQGLWPWQREPCEAEGPLRMWSSLPEGFDGHLWHSWSLFVPGRHGTEQTYSLLFGTSKILQSGCSKSIWWHKLPSWI